MFMAVFLSQAIIVYLVRGCYLMVFNVYVTSHSDTNNIISMLAKMLRLALTQPHFINNRKWDGK